MEGPEWTSGDTADMVWWWTKHRLMEEEVLEAPAGRLEKVWARHIYAGSPVDQARNPEISTALSIAQKKKKIHFL